MVALSDGRRSSKVLVLAQCGSAAVAVLLLAGCASEKEPQYVQGPMGQHVAQAQPRKVEMEDDGEPVQAPPVRKMHPEDDDPSQPWSPNYGRAGGGTPEPAQAPRATNRQIEASTRPLAPTSTGMFTRLTSTEANAIIAQAISAQEMQRQ
jgi:hypothetical protein